VTLHNPFVRLFVRHVRNCVDRMENTIDKIFRSVTS